MQIRGFYPPERKWIPSDPIVIRDQLGVIPFFADKTPEERLRWLESHATDTELYLEDVKDLAVRFVRIGGKFMTEALGIENINRLLQPNPDDPEGYWPIQQVVELFPRKPGSKARKATLVFRPSNWVLLTEPPRVRSSFEGVYINLMSVPARVGYGVVETPVFIHELQNHDVIQQVGIVLPEVKVALSPQEYLGVAREVVQKMGLDAGQVEIVAVLCGWMSPSIHKSLIQKVIRTNCESVEFNGVNYPAVTVLVTSFCMLLASPGSFVPNIQRYVTGAESATKRLAVSIHEDSYIEDPGYLLELYAASLLAQHRALKVDAKMLTRWLTIAIHGQLDPRMFDYDWGSVISTSLPRDFLLHEVSAIHYMNMLLLQELRSFETDIKMLASIAERGGRPREAKSPGTTGRVMPLIHCIDHHSLTEIAYYFPYTGETPTQIFGRIWSEVVGVNPRKPDHAKIWDEMAASPFVQDTRVAQRALWILGQSNLPHQLREIKDSPPVSVSYRLDPSWLGGLIGPQEVRVGAATIMVMLQLREEKVEWVCIKKPDRAAKELPEVSDDEREEALRHVSLQLNPSGRGIVLQGVPSTLSEFSGSSVISDGEDFWLRLSTGEITRWSDLLDRNFSLPIHPEVALDLDTALLTTGDGMMETGAEKLAGILQSWPVSVLRRSLTHLTGYRSLITLPKISRDGSGTELTVLPEDIGAHHFFRILSVLYPAALRLEKKGFVVRCGPLLWAIRDVLRQEVSRRSVIAVSPSVMTVWPRPIKDPRVPRPYQEEATTKMLTRRLEGKTGHLLWMLIGAGKTKIILDYITALIERGRAPNYICFSVPPSTIANLEQEIKIGTGLPYQVLDMRVGGLDQTLRPFMLNIVLHDHMRLGGLDQQLLSVAPQMLFIVDEVHLCLNATIRTSIALEVTKLSWDFVGLTGSLIKDRAIEILIDWLSNVVEFEVTPTNYWVALTSIIARRVELQSKLERHPLEVTMTDEEHKRYLSMVPSKLGGTASQLNFREVFDFCQAVITPTMVATTIHYVRQGLPVFLIARNARHQTQMATMLAEGGITRVHLISTHNPIVLQAGDPREIDVVIATPQHSTGYTLTKIHITITSVYLTNQATRDQLEGRTYRLGQPSPIVTVIVFHTGILSYILRNYDNVRTRAQVLKAFAKEIGIDELPPSIVSSDD